MEVRLLGPVDVMADDGSIVALPGQKLQHLLAALAVERGRVVTTDRLVTIVYGDSPPRQPANSLQVLVSRLRRRATVPGERELADRADGAGAVRFSVAVEITGGAGRRVATATVQLTARVGRPPSERLPSP